MTIEATIDPNVRVGHNLTFAGFEDIRPDRVVPTVLSSGLTIKVIEPEAGISGWAEVVGVDYEKAIVYLAVDWPSLKPMHG